MINPHEIVTYNVKDIYHMAKLFVLSDKMQALGESNFKRSAKLTKLANFLIFEYGVLQSQRDKKSRPSMG